MLVTGSTPFPFVTKDGSLGSFSTVSDSAFSGFSYGTVISGTYPLTSSISSDYYVNNVGDDIRRALKNTFNYYSNLSPHYSFDSDLGNKLNQTIRLISIPSIMYGQSIKKGSVELNFYVTGTLIGQLKDIKRNGELVQVGPQGSGGSGSVAGVVLYNEGFICLTGSWAIDTNHLENYIDATPKNPTWLHFMTTGSAPDFLVPSSSFALDFDGTEVIPTLTMFAKAGKGEFNHSNNLTYIEYGQEVTPVSSSNTFSERDKLVIKNVVHSEYDDQDPPFEKITYISKIALYDKERNLIGIAKLAKPVRKRQNDNIAFKLKLDI